MFTCDVLFLEPQVVDLTCTADEEVYDLTGVSEGPIILPEHSPIVVITSTYYFHSAFAGNAFSKQVYLSFSIVLLSA